MTITATPPASPSASPSPHLLGDRDLTPYYRDVYRWARAHLPTRQDAEDVTQEVMLRSWRSRDTYDGRASLRTWLRRITDNEVARFYQHNRIERAGHDDEDMPEPESPAPSPLRLVLASEGVERLERSKRALTPKERRAFMMRYQDEMSDREIAFRLQMTEGSVGQLLQRARRKVRGAAA